MPIKALKLDTSPKKALLIAAAIACAVPTFFFAKWGFGHTAASRADIVEVAEIAVYLAPDDPQTHFTSALFYEKTLDTDDAVKSLAEYEKATSLSPHDYLLWLELGRARERSGDRVGAEKALRHALNLAPNYVRIHWALGNVLLRQGKTDEAFEEIRISVAGDPTYTNAAVSTALQIFEGDIARVRTAIGDSPGLSGALAIQLAMQKRYREAFSIWDSLSEEEKTGSSSKELRDTLQRYFINGKQFRLALRTSSQIGSSNNQIGQFSNGGFEQEVKMQNAFDWQIGQGANPQIGVSNSQKHSGNYGLILVFNSVRSEEFRQLSQRLAVEPGKSYTLELFYRAEMQTRAGFRWEIATDAKNLAYTDPILNNSGWTQLGASFAVPDDTDGIVVRLIRENCNPMVCTVSGNLWFDDFRIVMSDR